MKYISQRLVSLIPTLFIVSLIIFGLMRVLPGDVAQMIDAAVRGAFGILRASNRCRCKKHGRAFRSVADFLQRSAHYNKYVPRINGEHIRIIRAEFRQLGQDS